MADKERLIDAELLTTNIAHIAKNCARSDAQKALIGRILFMIENMPTIEAEPVNHGRWIPSDDKNWLTCSFCGANVDVSCGAPFFYVDNDEVSHVNFCPNCGCKQDLEGGDING